MRRLRIVLALALALVAIPAGPALGAPVDPLPQTSVADVEDEVMCPICGTLLELANSPQAQRQKALIARMIASGKTKEEVKDGLVAEYGEEVLAVPSKSGFNLSAYLVPLIAFLIAIVVLAVSVARWRRRAGDLEPEESAPPASPQGADAERLDADLARYDL